MMKKVAALVAGAAATVGVVAGCSGGGSTEHQENVDQFHADMEEAGYAPRDYAEWSGLENDARAICAYDEGMFEVSMVALYTADQLDLGQIMVLNFCPDRVDEFNKVAKAHQPGLVVGPDFLKEK